MQKNNYRKISTLKTATDFASYCGALNIPLNFDETMQVGVNAPLAQPYQLCRKTIGNRWAILPMEGWDCTATGGPSELTERRWLRFGISGAKLLFGCEAAAVMPEGRSNTRQMMMNESTVGAIGRLRQKMVDRHAAKFGTADDLYVGLQLTHSGRYSHPYDDQVLESCTAYSHPLLDKKFGNDQRNVVTDEALDNIIDHFITAAKLSYQAGFDFVDIKHAHGYLGHELLSAVDRPGKYGGSFANRSRFFRKIVTGIKREVPGLDIAVRLSLFDFFPFEKGEQDIGQPMAFDGIYPYAFGGDGTGLGYDLNETVQFIELARSLGIELICTTVGSPYYNPHIQRPAYYPVSDGYLPPEDPLLGVARQIKCVEEVKRCFPDLAFIGSGYTYLQEWLPNVAQYAVANGMTDFVGIGRMVLSYPELCVDSLMGKPLDRRHLCRTFGDCTTAPRNGLISGCYPLDEHYKQLTEALLLKDLKVNK
jgi:2,4-dienoyl-CoA reductase-like NADH-dependent reductase (Old Yellow Enzyme family)